MAKAIVALTGSIVLGLTSPTAAAPQSGQYDNLYLAISEGTVTGYYEDFYGGDPPLFSCGFMLRGQLDGRHVRFTSWVPGDAGYGEIAGDLVFDGDGVLLEMDRWTYGGACPTEDTALRSEPELYPDEADWLAVTAVAAEKAPLRPAPGAPAPKRPYIVYSDPVAVLARQGSWVKVRYLSGGSDVAGWVQADELSPEMPPGGM